MSCLIIQDTLSLILVLLRLLRGAIDFFLGTSGSRNTTPLVLHSIHSTKYRHCSHRPERFKSSRDTDKHGQEDLDLVKLGWKCLRNTIHLVGSVASLQRDPLFRGYRY